MTKILVKKPSKIRIRGKKCCCSTGIIDWWEEHCWLLALPYVREEEEGKHLSFLSVAPLLRCNTKGLNLVCLVLGSPEAAEQYYDMTESSFNFQTWLHGYKDMNCAILRKVATWCFPLLCGALKEQQFYGMPQTFWALWKYLLWCFKPESKWASRRGKENLFIAHTT